MSNYIELLEQAQKQVDDELHTPSMNKLINAVTAFDSAIQRVAVIVNGRSLRQNDFNAYMVDILDIFDTENKVSINEEVSKVLEDSKYESNKLIISEAIKNKLNRCKAVLFIETENLTIKKEDGEITTHRWRLVNSNK